MNEGIPRSLYAPRWNEQADGGLGIGKGGLPHAAAAKSMAKSFSGTSPWNTEARTRRMAMCQETRLKNPKPSSGLGSRMRYGRKNGCHEHLLQGAMAYGLLS